MALNITWDVDTSVPSFPNPLNVGGTFYLVYQGSFSSADALNGTFTMSDGSTLASTPVPVYNENGNIVGYKLNEYAVYAQEGTGVMVYNSNSYEVAIPVTGIYFYYRDGLTRYGTSLYLPNESTPITDLSGTTWTIPAGWVAPGYVATMMDGQEYHITGTISYNGRTYTDLEYFEAYNLDQIRFSFKTRNEYPLNDQDITFNITGGEDATNPDLIAWFESGGTIRCTKTLKGVWRFKENFTFPSESNPNSYADLYQQLDFINREFHFNGSTEPGGPESYSEMDIHSGTKTIWYMERHHDGLEWLYSRRTVYAGSATGWYSDEDRYVALLYEQDVTDKFYTWFTANADDVTSSFVLIHYRNKLIGLVEDGHSCYLDCANYMMNTDVAISVPDTKPIVASPVTDSDTRTLKGVWRFKETITATQSVYSDVVCKYVGFDNGIFEHVSSIDVYVNDDGFVRVSYMEKCTDGGYIGGNNYRMDSGWDSDMYRHLYFPSELTVPEDFYKWFIANAEDITDSATFIEFNGELVGVLLSGMTARLPCKDLIMPSNVTVTARKVAEGAENYYEEPNALGTTVVILSHTEETNNLGTTVII